MCKRLMRTGTIGLGLTAAMMMSILPGCSVDVLAGFRGPSGNGQGDDDQTVRIRFVNLAVNEAVNVEFYATDDPLELLPDDLFVDENLVTANIGVAGLGIIEPSAVDSIDFPCTEGLTIGTLGGIFLDNDSGELRGVGTARWAQEGQWGEAQGAQWGEAQGAR